ncbi:hypothetical protein EYF80_031610 [Liparis tanakae]|uniref:Uncharacterized protein n=1 Tax=Liparis tanakae TaxID=230148 RepID=A0A4Z2GX08_9TELE|nr:hypothetical protein EYF80_031610 [Liparis tanakae]
MAEGEGPEPASPPPGPWAQVRPAVDAAVGAVTAGQVSLEGLGLGHLHHIRGAGLLAGGVRAGAGGAAAPLDSLTEEALEEAGESRRRCGAGVWRAPHRHHGRKSHLEVKKVIV